MSEPRLPDDLIRFLGAGLQLEYDSGRCECGRITLLPREDLRIDDFSVTASRKEQAFGDPNRGRRGMYWIPAVNLVATAEGYDPEGILLWVPAEESFGTWDCDHHDLWLFPDQEWSEIAADPLPYVTSQWCFEGVDKQWLVPWPKYPFRDEPQVGASL